MMSNNKILTVSYGTFSCTLEGFEDSFDTMKAIAEYFRDLAADDRYFGAEPPQPDVEMLARIAEREVARRVEAHQSEDGYHLRTAATAATALAATDAVAGHPAPEPKQDVAAEEIAPLPVAADPAPEAPVVEENVTETPGVETTPQAMPTPPMPTPPVPTPEDQSLHQEDVEAKGADVPPVEETVDAAVSTQADDTAAETEDVMQASWDYPMQGLMSDTSADAAQEVAAAEVKDTPLHAEPVEAPLEQAELEPNSIADKLQRIRDVVAKSQSDAAAYSEDQHADEFLDSDDAEDDFDQTFEDDAELDDTEAAVAAFTQGLADEQQSNDVVTNDTSAETDPEQSVVETPVGDDVFDEVAAALATDDTSLDEPVAPDANEEPEQSSSEDDDLEIDLARIAAELDADDAVTATPAEGSQDTDIEAFDTDDLMIDEDDLAALASDAPQDDASKDDSAYVLDPSALAEPLDDPQDHEEPAAAASKQRRVRVLRVNKKDVNQAIEDGKLQEVDAEEPVALSDDDEVELLRELAEVEAELEADGISNVMSDDAKVVDLDDDLSGQEDDVLDDGFDDLDEAVDSSAARLLEQASGQEEDALDRLMAEADSQMEEPEGTSRRSAFSHLRAAVAATKADRQLSSAAGSPKDDDYRTDLAAAVKPRRPVAKGERLARPETERPAPLKLVAEQRVDSENAPTSPVQPRRVAISTETTPDESGNFADYAEARGAKDLSEVLEAAASYLSFVEGREQFSRPQLMTKVRQLELDDFTREDGLRHFGQLLRAGKIEKIKGGRFTVSDDIGFRPEDDHRAAG